MSAENVKVICSNLVFYLLDGGEFSQRVKMKDPQMCRDRETTESDDLQEKGKGRKTRLL